MKRVKERPTHCCTIQRIDDDDDWRERRRKEEQAWTQIFSRLIAQWGQWFTHIVGTVVHRVVFRRHESGGKIVDIDLTPIQESRLQKLQQRLEVPFDGTQSEHQDALKSLWRAAFPDRDLRGLVSEQWKEMGWQGTDPSTDFRGGGYISLENLLFLLNVFRYVVSLEKPRGKNVVKSFQRMLHKEEGKRARWEYPFAVAGINISFMLIQMLDLRSAKPSSNSGVNFLKILGEDEMAFDMLYCVAFEVMDAQWLAMRASYMEFNAVLGATRNQIERELSLKNVTCIRDMPAYNMLCE